MLGCAAADAPTAPRHCDLALESTMPQTKWCGTPGGVGAMGGINITAWGGRHRCHGHRCRLAHREMEHRRGRTIRADGDLVFCPRGTGSIFLVKNWSCDDSKCVNIDISQKLVKNWSYDDSKCRNIGFHIIGQILVTGIAKTQIGRNLADKVPDQGHDQLFPCGETS